MIKFQLIENFFFDEIRKKFGNDTEAVFIENPPDWEIDQSTSTSNHQILRFEYISKCILSAEQSGISNIKILSPSKIHSLSSNYKDNTVKTFHSIAVAFLMASNGLVDLKSVEIFHKYYLFNVGAYNKFLINFVNSLHNNHLSIIESQSEEILNLNNKIKDLAFYKDIAQISNPSIEKNITFGTRKSKAISYLEKYLLFLIYQKKLKYSSLFDESFYKKKYPDLSGLKSPIKHFIFYGIDEGRVGSPEFLSMSKSIREDFNSSEKNTSWKKYLLSRM